MAASVTAPKTVLVASQADPVQDRFSEALQAAGHTAIAARSADSLLECLRARGGAVDLIILDLRLDAPPGIGLVRSIRELALERLPVLVFGGSISGADAVRALSALGVAGYVNEHSRPERIVPALAPHLFPDSFDRRTSARVKLGIPITCRFDGGLAAAFMLNLASGGVGVRTAIPLAAGARVHVRFRLPGSERDIEAATRVAWRDARLGLGLQFEAVDAADQAAIDAFVDRHTGVEVTGPRKRR